MRILTLMAVAITLTAALAEAQYRTPTTQQPLPPTAAPSNAGPLETTSTGGDELATARRMTRDQAMRLVKQKKAVYVDVRSKESFDEGHLPGAISLPLSQLQSRYKDLPVKKLLITYCA